MGQCLDALTNQSYDSDRYEIIVVDNGSNDASVDIVNNYPGVHLLHESERGSYAARNRGIRQAVGTVLAFIDPDCVPDRNWLSTIAEGMQNPETLLLLGKRYLATSSRTMQLIETYEQVKDLTVLQSNAREHYYGYTNNMAVRATVLAETGGFKKIMRGADTMFVQGLANSGAPNAIKFRREMVVTHLEVDSLTVYYKKIFLYAFYRRAAGESAEPLSFSQRLHIYRQALLERGASGFEAVYLLATLSIGAGLWYAGLFAQSLRRLLRIASKCPAILLPILPHSSAFF